MWVSVSNIFDVKVIVQKILHTIAEKPEDHSMDNCNINFIKKLIKRNTYLFWMTCGTKILTNGRPGKAY